MYSLNSLMITVFTLIFDILGFRSSESNAWTWLSDCSGRSGRMQVADDAVQSQGDADHIENDAVEDALDSSVE